MRPDGRNAARTRIPAGHYTYHTTLPRRRLRTNDTCSALISLPLCRTAMEQVATLRGGGAASLTNSSRRCPASPRDKRAHLDPTGKLADLRGAGLLL